MTTFRCECRECRQGLTESSLCPTREQQAIVLRMDTYECGEVLFTLSLEKAAELRRELERLEDGR